MAVDLPETTKVLGARSVWVVPVAAVTGGDPEAVTSTILNAAFKATCFIYGDGGTVMGEQAKGDAPKKLCEQKTREQLGTVKESISDIQYSYKPQADNTDEANAMKAALTPGTKVYVFDRLGVLDETAATAGDFFNASLTTLGVQNRTKTGDDDFAEFSITQSASVENTWWDIELAS